jgi:hypothetical protein
VIACNASFRLAKPHSWWALTLYRDQQLSQARRRYPRAPSKPATVLAALAWVQLALVGAIAVLVPVGAVGPS